MGLLDLIGSSSGGGLFDFLRNNAMSQQFPSGLASDQAQYGQQVPSSQVSPLFMANNQPNPLDNARWPQGPVGAPMQANAQMPQQAPTSMVQPQAPQDSGMGIGDRLGAGFRGFMANAQNGPIGALLGGVAGIAGMGQGSVDNQTAKALLAKGVDPQTVQAAIANPELMSTLIKQTYGPHNIQSIGDGYVYDPQSNKVVRAYTPEKQPLSLGNGYIYKDGKVVQAYEPGDKIPVGFQKTDNGLQPIPGGPADPEYLRAKATDPNAVKVLGKGGELYKVGPDGQPVVVHKNQDGSEATLSDESTKAMAAQYLSGDRTVLQNLGRGAQGAANIVKLREEITKQAHDAGMSSKDIVTTFNEQAGNLAGQRAVGTRAANISLAANEANNMIPIALAASDKVPRSQWMPWNKMVQAYQTGASSPELASFVAATNSLVNSYVRAVSPSGVPTDSMREHAYSMLNSAQGPEAFKAVVDTMKLEMKAALEAPSQVKKELRGDGNQEGNKPVVIDGYKIMAH
jgi:hypothetical protein